MTQPPLRTRGRPMGEVASAMLSAAAHGPGTVAELARRSCVGYGAARYTASRLVSSGALVALSAGRPAVLGAPEAAEAPQWSPERLGVALEQLRGVWGRVVAADGERGADR